MSKQSDYEKGVKYGLNSSDGNDFMDDMASIVIDPRNESRRKGEEFGREQRHRNERKEASSNKYDQSSNTCDSGYGYSGGSSYGDSGSTSIIGAMFYVIMFSVMLIIGILVAFIPVCIVVDFISHANQWGGGAKAVEHRASNILGTIFIIGEFLIIGIAIKSVSK